MSMAAMVAAKVAIMHGIKISVGLELFNEALMAMMLTGIKVSPDACKHRNMIWAVGRRVFIGINFLQAFHRFYSKGRSRIIEAQ